MSKKIEKIIVKPIIGIIYKSTNMTGAIICTDKKGQKYTYQFDKIEADAWNKNFCDNTCWIHSGCISDPTNQSINS